MRISIIVLFLVFTSCINDEAYYSCNNTTIKRIDTNGKSEFYYMKNGKESGKIWAEYSGINDGFAGYLIFGKNGNVTLFNGDGYFQYKDIDSLLFKYKRYSGEESDFNLPNICRIWYPIEKEQYENKIHMTKVKIKYITH